jgi:hypothetical protein
MYIISYYLRLLRSRRGRDHNGSWIYNTLEFGIVARTYVSVVIGLCSEVNNLNSLAAN